MHPNIKPYLDLVEEGYLRQSIKDNLILFGYTDKCTFDRHWNEFTLSARGLIFDSNTGEIVAMPFPKFFNLGETPETSFANLPINTDYEIFDKVDGSLGIIFHHNNQWQIATRGSFYSDQAVKGSVLLNKYDLTETNKNFTLLVEIIYPENRIISDYGKREDLILLGAYSRKSKEEVSYSLLELISWETQLPIVARFNYSTEEAISKAKNLPRLVEGFVVRYDNGLRVKIKGEEYMKIAKIVSHLSPLFFWEVMVDGKVPQSYLEQIPEEFSGQWETQVHWLETQYLVIFNKVCLFASGLKNMSPRDIGIFIKDNPFKYKEMTWPLINGKREQLDKMILNAIRPKGNVLKEE